MPIKCQASGRTPGQRRASRGGRRGVAQARCRLHRGPVPASDRKCAHGAGLVNGRQTQAGCRGAHLRGRSTSSQLRKGNSAVCFKPHIGCLSRTSWLTFSAPPNTRLLLAATSPLQLAGLQAQAWHVGCHRGHRGHNGCALSVWATRLPPAASWNWVPMRFGLK